MQFMKSLQSSNPEAFFKECMIPPLKKVKNWGIPGWLSRLAPPSAQGMVLETWDQSHIRLSAGSLLLPLPVSLLLSLCLS